MTDIDTHPYRSNDTDQMPSKSPYPRFSFRVAKTTYGEAIDAYATTAPYTVVSIGRHNTEDQARAAYEHFVKTGEKPQRKPYQHGGKGRTARIARANTRSGIRYLVRGAHDIGPGIRRPVYVGAFLTEEKAEAARSAFLETGERFITHRILARASRTGDFNKPRTGRVSSKPIAGGQTRWYAYGKDYDENRKRKDYYIGAYLTKEDAEAARDEFLRTGEIKKTEAACSRHLPDGHRSGWIAEYQLASGLINYAVRGEEYVDGKRKGRYVGSFVTMEQALAAKDEFIRNGTLVSTGRRHHRSLREQAAPKVAKPKRDPKATARAPRGPRIKAAEVRIEPGRNLRDHEIDALARHRPELVGLGKRPKPLDAVQDQSRIRLPGEDFATWVKRITDTGVAA